MNIVTIKMVTMYFLTCAVLEYIASIICYQFIQHSQWRHFPAHILPNTIYSAVLSLLNSKKAVQIHQFTDGASIVSRKHYYTGLNHITMVFSQHVLSIKTLTIIFIMSVLFFLNFNLTPSIKVSANSNRLLEIIKDTINTLRL